MDAEAYPEWSPALLAGVGVTLLDALGGLAREGSGTIQ